jgi:DNA-directed RNA polymerase subunit P
MSNLGSIIYECERCGTKQSLEELSRYPEIKCKSCGYRVLRKVRSSLPKKIEHAV